MSNDTEIPTSRVFNLADATRKAHFLEIYPSALVT